jgi:hypothetical protein
MPEPVDVYRVNGVDLRSLATWVETSEGLQSAAALLGDDIGIDGLDGVLDPYADPASPRRASGPAGITFSMALSGVDRTTGQVPGGSSSLAQYFARWDELVRLFYRRTLTIEHPRLDGTTRTATGRLVSALEPSRERSSPWFGRFKAEVLIPAGYWTDGTSVDTGLVTLASGATLDLSGFASATAPCPCSVRFGPGNNPKISLNSRSFQWAATIAAGRQVLADSVTGLITQGAGSAWTPGYQTHVVVGARRYFEVDPADAAQVATVTTTGGTVAVQVTGPRRYRTS